MRLAIHNSSAGFHPRWIQYCEKHNIAFKLVNCYSNSIIKDIQGCDALMWHHHQEKTPDILIAKSLLSALEQAGIVVFPDFNTAWHFDDKIGQKYLLEAIKAPLIPTYIFYNKEDALSWASQTQYPKVWKLRGGAGSANVQLIRTQAEAKKKIKRAFGRGFNLFNGFTYFKERWRKYRTGSANLLEVMKGIFRLAYTPSFSKVAGPERGYVYFQEFIPGNDFDTRVIVVEGKAFALKRMVRKNDFRASGSGDFAYEKHEFDERCIQVAFKLTRKLKAQCLAYDFVFNSDGEVVVIEYSYGFRPSGYDICPGYWDEEMTWHEGPFDPQGWMVEHVLQKIKCRSEEQHT